jgi:hypothetical protein
MYNLRIDRGFALVCPVSEIYNNTSSDRLQLIEFYESELGQIIYSWRNISVEQLIEHIKDVFDIDPLPIRRYQKATGIVLLSVLLYQIIVSQLQDTQRTSKSNQTHVRKLINNNKTNLKIA